MGKSQEKAFYSFQENIKEGLLIFKPKGFWHSWCLKSIFMQLEHYTPLVSVKTIWIDLSDLISLDTTGTLLLMRLKKKFESYGITVLLKNKKRSFDLLFSLTNSYSHTLPYQKKTFGIFRDFLFKTGFGAIQIFEIAKELLSFFGEVLIHIFMLISGQKKLRFTSFCVHLQIVGLNAVPIISLISFLIGVVLAYQSVTQLTRFGAEIFTVNLLGLGILREVGILITAIVVAGRSGSAFTAQIGTMVLNEEISAMQTMGLDPISVLVIPRLLALVIVLPLLAFLSDMVGIAGGAFMTKILMDLSYVQFLEQLKGAITPTTFWIGIIKAPVFAFLIALVGCFEGLKVEGSAESVGKRTTKSVVEAIFLVIVADAAFSILFSYLKI